MTGLFFYWIGGIIVISAILFLFFIKGFVAVLCPKCGKKSLFSVGTFNYGTLITCPWCKKAINRRQLVSGKGELV